MYGRNAYSGGGDTYTVTFDLNGGAGTFAPITVIDGKKVAKPSASPAKEDYEFVGWSSVKTAYSEYDFNAKIHADTTVFAFWKTPGAALITVTFNLNGGGGAIPTQQLEAGFRIGAYTAPARAGYVFGGWSLVKDNAETVINDTTYSASASVTLYALWVVSTPEAIVNAAIRATLQQTTGYTLVGYYGSGIATVKVKFLSGTLTAFYREEIGDTNSQKSWWLDGKRYFYYIYNGETSAERQTVASGEFYEDVHYLEYFAFDASAVFESVTVSGNAYTMSYGGNEITATIANGVVTSWNVTAYDGYTFSFAFDYANGIVIPPLPAGANWVDRYIVIIRYPDGSTDTYMPSNGTVSPSGILGYLKTPPITQSYLDVYKDAAFTVSFNAEVTLTADLTLYVKAENITGTALTVLLAFEATDALASYELVQSYSDGTKIVYGNAGGKLIKFYASNCYSYYFIDKMWVEYSGGYNNTTYIIKGTRKSMYVNASGGDLSIPQSGALIGLAFEMISAIKADAVITEEGGGVYNVGSAGSVKIEDRKVTSVTLHNDTIVLNTGATQIEQRPADGWARGYQVVLYDVADVDKNNWLRWWWRAYLEFDEVETGAYWYDKPDVYAAGYYYDIAKQHPVVFTDGYALVDGTFVDQNGNVAIYVEFAALVYNGADTAVVLNALTVSQAAITENGYTIVNPAFGNGIFTDYYDGDDKLIMTYLDGADGTEQWAYRTNTSEYANSFYVKDGDTYTHMSGGGYSRVTCFDEVIKLITEVISAANGGEAFAKISDTVYVSNLQSWYGKVTITIVDGTIRRVQYGGGDINITYDTTTVVVPALPDAEWQEV